MKHFALFLIVILFSVNVCAGWGIEINQYAFSSEEYSSLENDIPQIKLRYGFNGFNIFVSGERNELFLVGQPAYDIYLVGAGVGYEYPLTDKIALCGDVGYYYPFYDAGTDEGQRYYMNALVVGNAEGNGQRFWEEYSIAEIEGGFGVDLSIKYQWKWFGLKAGYRYLTIDMMYVGESPSLGMVRHGDCGWWELKDTQDYSGYFVGLAVEF